MTSLPTTPKLRVPSHAMFSKSWHAPRAKLATAMIMRAAAEDHQWDRPECCRMRPRSSGPGRQLAPPGEVARGAQSRKTSRRAYCARSHGWHTTCPPSTACHACALAELTALYFCAYSVRATHPWLAALLLPHSVPKSPPSSLTAVYDIAKDPLHDDEAMARTCSVGCDARARACNSSSAPACQQMWLRQSTAGCASAEGGIRPRDRAGASAPRVYCSLDARS